jgi:hypothetical protein
MRVVKEFNLEDFEAWAGGRDTLDTLIEKNLVEKADIIIEQYFNDCGDVEPPTETELNDLLWFEREWLAEALGFGSWDELEGCEEIYNDINGVKLDVGDDVHWHDEAGRDENGEHITFTIVDEDGEGYFNLAYGDEDENPDRWAYYTELEIV